jgi:hypothetical protein
MLYLVEAHPTIEVGDRTDSDEGPGPYIAKIIERFQPQAIYGNATGVRLFWSSSLRRRRRWRS